MFNFLKKNKNISLVSPMKGTVLEITAVPDQVFSEKMLGDGIAIEPLDGLVVSPIKGTVVQIFPTNHAIGIESEEGLEVLIHLGIDTVELKGEGFTRLITEGASVEVGTPLLSIDLNFVHDRGKLLTTPIVITNSDKFEIISKNLGAITPGSTLMELKKK